MKIEVYNQPTLFDELRSEWNDLVQRSTANRIFSTWEWNSTWWNAYHPGELWVIAIRDSQGRLIGLAPWFIGGSTDNQRIVSTIGCKEVTDYLDLIIDRDHVNAVADRFAAFLLEQRDHYDRIELCNIPEDSISYTAFPALLERHGFRVTLAREDVCPIIKLPKTWSEYLAILDKKNRHELRRKMRRAQGVNSEVDWYIVGREHDLEAEMKHFLEMMADSDPSKARFLADPQNMHFFKQITAVLREVGWLQLNFLVVNGQRAASYLNFDYNGHILVYNSGLRTEYIQFSPGIVLLAHNIQYAIETGREVFDFLQGNEAYKYHLGGKDVAVWNLIAN